MNSWINAKAIKHMESAMFLHKQAFGVKTQQRIQYTTPAKPILFHLHYATKKDVLERSIILMQQGYMMQQLATLFALVCIAKHKGHRIEAISSPLDTKDFFF